MSTNGEQMAGHPPTREHFAMHLQLTKQYFVGAIAALILCLPLSLVAASGTLRAVGQLYLVVWALVFLPTAAASLWLTFDAFLMVFNRPPVLLPRMLVAQRQNDPLPSRRVNRVLQRFARVAFWVNPLWTVALATLVVAVRLRPHRFAEMMHQVEEVVRHRPTAASAEPYAEFSSHILEQVAVYERELVAC